MRPVNLIPQEDRRTRPAGSSGALSYLIVGSLVVILAMVTLMVLTNNQISDRKQEVAQLESERAAAQARSESLRSFADFRTMQEQRTATVVSLAESRFDWERVLRELSLILPSDVWLTSLTGTVSPAVQLEEASAISIRSTVPGPALEIIGCTTSQAAVGRFVADLRDVGGVTRVTVSKSELPDQSAGSTATTSGSATSTTDADCQTRDFIARFEIVAAFDAVPVPEEAAPTTTAPTAPAAPASGDTDPATEGSTASQDAVQQGIQQGQQAANLAPGH